MSESHDPSLTPKTSQQFYGRIGEDVVARHYADQGYRVVARNVHISHNEIDLIVADDRSLVFVEVKTRHGVFGAHSRYGRPAAAVDKGKRRRTVAAAQAYLRTHQKDFPTLLQPRIDVAEVYMTRREDGTHDINHVEVIRNAFGAKA